MEEVATEPVPAASPAPAAPVEPAPKESKSTPISELLAKLGKGS
jgi:hypothetical protein